MKKIITQTINVKGMTCKSCVVNIKDNLLKKKGIIKVNPVLQEDKVVVSFDKGKISLKDIKKEINLLGYNVDNKDSSIKKGILFGLIPHIGCIAFIIASILGSTVLVNFIKPFLMNKYFFYILILISILFATIASIIYLKQNSLLSLKGIKKKKVYLMTMYGLTIGITVFLFLFIFPLFSNLSTTDSKTDVSNQDLSSLKTLSITVDIPCSGHAPLITDELKKINGVNQVKFSLFNNFLITYDSSKTNKKEILALDIFKTYKASER